MSEIAKHMMLCSYELVEKFKRRANVVGLQEAVDRINRVQSELCWLMGFEELPKFGESVPETEAETEGETGKT